MLCVQLQRIDLVELSAKKHAPGRFQKSGDGVATVPAWMLHLPPAHHFWATGG